jgi:signal transduction histidine kinase
MAVPEVSSDIPWAKWPAVWARLRECGALTFEARNRAKDGSLIPVEVSLNFLSYAGKEHGYAFIRDMTEHRRAEQKTLTSFERMRAHAARLQCVQEEERKGIANAIHDRLCQALAAIKLDVASFARNRASDRELSAARIESLLNLLDETMGDARRIAMELRPAMLDDLGLSAALGWSAEQFQSRTGIACLIDAPEDATPADPQAAIAIFRILQEALANVAHHAGASRVETRLTEENGGLVLEIHDDGRGFDPGQISGGKSLGILGMRERALSVGGEFSIRGAPGEGTTVTVWVPAVAREPAKVRS